VSFLWLSSFPGFHGFFTCCYCCLVLCLPSCIAGSVALVLLCVCMVLLLVPLLVLSLALFPAFVSCCGPFYRTQDHSCVLGSPGYLLLLFYLLCLFLRPCIPVALLASCWFLCCPCVTACHWCSIHVCVWCSCTYEGFVSLIVSL